MKTTNINPIRHSSLPKLAECPCFEGKPGEAGPAAARGTLLDLAMRELIAGGEMPTEVTGEDAAADVAQRQGRNGDDARGVQRRCRAPAVSRAGQRFL